MKHHILFTTESIVSDYYGNADMDIRKAFPPEYIEENSSEMQLFVVDLNDFDVLRMAELLSQAQHYGESLFLSKEEFEYMSEYL